MTVHTNYTGPYRVPSGNGNGARNPDRFGTGGSPAEPAPAPLAKKVTFNGELCFPNEYLSAIEFRGRDVTLTISSVSREMLKKIGGRHKMEMVFRFERTPKKFVCNLTNAQTIGCLHGTRAELWVGKKITLYPTRCLAFGEMVDCIRVRPRVPAGQRTQAPPVQIRQAVDEVFGTEAEEQAASEPTPITPTAATRRADSQLEPYEYDEDQSASIASENQMADGDETDETGAVRD